MIVAGLVIGLAGVLTMAIFVLLDCRSFYISCFASANEIIWPAGIGAVMAGAMLFALFGGAGRKGWLMAALGAVLATVLGAVLGVLVLGLWSGGGLLKDPAVVFFGPWFILMTFIQRPVTFFLWAGIMAVAHLVLRRLFGKYTQV